MDEPDSLFCLHSCHIHGEDLSIRVYFHRCLPLLAGRLGFGSLRRIEVRVHSVRACKWGAPALEQKWLQSWRHIAPG